MKVILIVAVPNLGKVGDVVNVKNGFARNFLVPNKKAIYFNDNNYKAFEEKKHEYEEQNILSMDRSNKIKALLADKNIIIVENASDDGRLYGSVTASVIADKLSKIVKSETISSSEIFLKKPIKEIGIYQVKAIPHSEVTFEIKVVVARSEIEGDAMINPKAAEKNSDPVKEVKKRVKKAKADRDAAVAEEDSDSE